MQDGLEGRLEGLCHHREVSQDKEEDHTFQGRGQQVEEAGARG